MTIRGDLFSPGALESLDDATRSVRIAELTATINASLANAADLASFQTRLYAVIEALKSIGHDIWSHDYDNEIEEWGGNYMNPEAAGKLWLTSTYPAGVELIWKAWEHDDAP